MFGSHKEYDWERFWRYIKRTLLNKYAIVLLTFAFIVLFAGDKSLLSTIHRAREIHHLEQQRDYYLQEIHSAEQGMKMLQNTDSLERFAREQYYMHTTNEDIYLIEE